MSRIGREPVNIPAGVTVSVAAGVVEVSGKLGVMSYTVPRGITVQVQGSEIIVTRDSDTRKVRGFHGLARTLVANMLTGVSEGYKKGLEIEGVGFRAAVSGDTVSLSLGFASPKEYKVPEGVTVTEDGGTKLTVSGIDKQLVGRVAADIRAHYPAEPYKGKGIRYAGEQIRRKEGKKVA